MVGGEARRRHAPVGRRREAALFFAPRTSTPGSVDTATAPRAFGPERRNAAGQPVGGHEGGRVADTPLPAGWKPALAYPVTDLALPADFAVKEIADALGLVLVNHDGMTLYAIAGRRTTRERAVFWTPVEAPQLSDPVGDFNFILRTDGIKQWTYKGRGLYTYAGDLGSRRRQRHRRRQSLGCGRGHALLPAGQRLGAIRSLARGKVLATDKGLTLYRREAHIGSDRRRPQSPPRPTSCVRPSAARSASRTCVATMPAAKSGIPTRRRQGPWPRGSGRWATHPDGFKQWVYQGYTLWTYDGDKKPGDMRPANDESHLCLCRDA